MTGFWQARDMAAFERTIVNQRVGEELRIQRERKRITLRALADKVGVSAPYLSDVEHGRRALPRHSEVAKALGLKRDHFVKVAGICSKCGGSGLDGTGTRGGR